MDVWMREDKMLTASIECFDDLSDQEKECVPNNGVGKEYASYLRLRHNGHTILLKSNAMEPEDVSFYRDLSWVVDWLIKMYELGKQEQRDLYVSQTTDRQIPQIGY